MSTRTHVFIVVVAVVAALLVLRLVATRQLRSKYALLWLGVAVAMIVVAAFPGLLDELADVMGVDIFVEEAKKNHPYLFKAAQTTNVNGTTPGGVTKVKQIGAADLAGMKKDELEVILRAGLSKKFGGA